MEVVTVPSYEDLSLRAAETVCKAIGEKPDLVLGLPTGATPIGMYRQLVAAHRRGTADFSRVRTFNLDEYLGLSPDHPASYHTYMWDHFLSHINLQQNQVHIPNGTAPDPYVECQAYENAIAGTGYLDLAVLGIGLNGHVGFNEPGLELRTNVHVARLSAETRRLAFEYWSETDPRHFARLSEFPSRAITMGMGTILKAERILLMASGASKAQAVHRAITGPLTPQVPASFLQLHRHVIVLVDSPAAGLL